MCRRHRDLAPVVHGRIEGDRTRVLVWCYFCKKDHSHARCRSFGKRCTRDSCTCPLGSGDGHRVAHCSGDTRSESPYFVTGYTIEEIETFKTVRRQPKGETHVLYRFFDAEERLLYIGITANPPKRFKGHRGDKEWWNQVAIVRLESFDGRDELQDAERGAIETEAPLYNIIHNGWRRAVHPGA